MVNSASDPICRHKVALTKTLIEDNKRIIISQNRNQNAPIVEGKLINYGVPSSFTLYGGRSTELLNSHVIAPTVASVIITVVLEGKLSFGYDNLDFNLNGEQQAEAVMVNLSHAAHFRRSIAKDNQLAKVNLILHPQWITSRIGKADQANEFFSGHLNHIRIPVSAALKHLVEQVLDSEDEQNLASHIKLESLSLQILSEMFAHLDQQRSVERQPSKVLKKHSRIDEIINYIEAHLEESLTLQHIAAQFSMSSSNLQKRFRDHLGLTVNSYIRSRRLRIAKQHLEQGLVTITEAAYEAGYKHPANFTNAFKKTFGFPPTAAVKP
ncbi:AraC family transcriptional regulator [Vibrio sp. RE88]|uniref:helix-turn-helix domain-containing protein n=1 Tax=Vibrio sp. RE88 TaxID=2607610 RepID=UPI001493AF03|nr:AraC family transcriptional regulator [Vibrio sp. RE88]NOH62597.1 helix-turn-helix transcriptional regulator [Vibrio sp. RE88]